MFLQNTENVFQPKTMPGEIMAGVAEIIRAIKYPGVRVEGSLETGAVGEYSWIILIGLVGAIAYMIGGRK